MLGVEGSNIDGGINGMGSISKHQKTEDRLSNLPNNLISYILSLLPTKDAVRTSALSTHWNQQWALITKLDFNDLSVGNTSSSRARFVNFVYRVLLFNVRRLELFRLTCTQDYGVSHVSAWLFAALSRNVRQVDLMVPMDGSRHLQSDCLFSSRTLEVLKIGQGFLLRIPMTISLESLKILHFSEVEFEDSESLSRLVSSCPVLEELRIEFEGVFNERVTVINISSLVLKKLLIIRVFCLPLSSLRNRFHPYEVVLNTPSLEYLAHDGYVPRRYHIETLQCLDRASLSFDLSDEQTDLYAGDPMLEYPLEDLAAAISNVQSLVLSDDAFEIFCRPGLNEAQWPTFPRLTDLEIYGHCFDRVFFALTSFLGSTPQLESFSFKLGGWCEDWHPPTIVPFCLRYSLKVIKLDIMNVLEKEELDIIKYFLNHTNCLKELILLGLEVEAANAILMFPRASQSCKIVYSIWS